MMLKTEVDKTGYVYAKHTQDMAHDALAAHALMNAIEELEFDECKQWAKAAAHCLKRATEYHAKMLAGECV